MEDDRISQGTSQDCFSPNCRAEAPQSRRAHLPTPADADRDALDADLLAKAATDAILQRDRAVLRQLVASAKEAKYQRAFDLARRLELPESLDLALRIAESHGEEALTSRVENLLAFRNELGLQNDRDGEVEPGGNYPPSQAYESSLGPQDHGGPQENADVAPNRGTNHKAALERRSSNAPSPVDGKLLNATDAVPPKTKLPANFNPFKIAK